MNLSAGQQWRCRLENRLMEMVGEERVGWTERGTSKHTHHHL